MFYAQLLMSKRGPLSKIWLAAHWDKKLTKAHVFECNLETTIEKILSPKVNIALRTSGHLLLGVVRIYHRKAKYLLADCNEAFFKMRMAFRPGIVDLPGDHLEASYNAITLPEEFHEFEIKLPDINAIDVAEHFTLNRSRAEDITLREDYGGGILHSGDEVEMFRQNCIYEDNLNMSADSLFPDQSSASPTGDRDVNYHGGEMFKLDGFGDEGAAGDMLDNLLNAEQDAHMEDILDSSKGPSLPPLPIEDDINAMGNEDLESEVLPPAAPIENKSPFKESTLLLNEDDGFVLEPVDATASVEKKKSKRKRKLLVDTVKELSSSTMRKQLTDFHDTVTTVDIAPPTRKLMVWKEIGGVENLLAMPSQNLIHCKLQMLFTRCLVTNNPRTCNEREEVELEREELRKEHDFSEMPMLEEPSCLDTTEVTETNTTSLPKSSILQLQNGDDHENQVDIPLADSPSLHNSSLNQENEKTLAEPATSVAFYEDPMESEQDSEERRWNKRTRQILYMLREMSSTGVVSFSLLELCKDNNRKQASAKFYSFLVLKKQSAIELSQSAPYADVIATAGPRFNTI
ncbi:double-strand-break repair protein rad21-like protein 1 isoform X2 [Ambystoma mexicanum]|uniref:double-strand-break repair protein rad21-like protein 1 isoform X2 n=1 Tax=Ambystoma mexicanum TaxID=8296 RepID=UPI0037E905B7